VANDATALIWEKLGHQYLGRPSIASERTRTAYRQIIGDWLDSISNDGGMTGPSDITYEHVSTFVTEPISQKHSKNERTRKKKGKSARPSPAYQQLRLTVLAGLLEIAINNDLATKNFARIYRRQGTSRKNGRKKHHLALSVDEWDSFFEAMQGLSKNEDIKFRNCAIFILFANSGLRVSELASMRTANIDFDSMMFSVIGKGGDMETIPIHPDITGILKEWLDNYRPSFLGDRQSEFVWPSKISPHISSAQIQRMARKSFKIAGITRENSYTGPHLLRHTIATRALDEGVTLRAVSAFLRHKSIETTRQFYDHGDEDTLKRSVVEATPKISGS